VLYTVFLLNIESVRDENIQEEINVTQKWVLKLIFWNMTGTALSKMNYKNPKCVKYGTPNITY
jgi:hypothetical protein